MNVSTNSYSKEGGKSKSRSGVAMGEPMKNLQVHGKALASKMSEATPSPIPTHKLCRDSSSMYTKNYHLILFPGRHLHLRLTTMLPI